MLRRNAPWSGLANPRPLKESRMSNPEHSNTSLPYELLICSDPVMLPRPLHLATDRIYEELRELAELMPTRYRDVFCFRWGLNTHFPHLTSQTARKFEIPNTTAERMLNQALWNITRYARSRQLPTVQRLLGEDRVGWAERAWRHAQQRWGHQDSTFSETVLLLSVGGMDVPEAHQVARQHMISLGLAKVNQWGRPQTAQQQANNARSAIDRILKQTIWPPSVARLDDLSVFTTQRPLPAWAPAKAGVFRSDKLNRLVQFDSTLELLILRQLESDPRVISYQEQPLSVPFELDEEARAWVPDIIALTTAGTIVIEAKPLYRLGEFTNWIKWSALADYCQKHGFGFWIGSPERSLLEHQQLKPDPDKHELVLQELDSGVVTGGQYDALRHLVGYEQLGLIATRELLEWEPSTSEIKRAAGNSLDQAREFWAVVATSETEQRPPNRQADSDVDAV